MTRSMTPRIIRRKALNQMGTDRDLADPRVGRRRDPHEPEPGGGERRRQPFRIRDNLLLILGKRRLGRLFQADGLRGNDVHQRTTLHARKECAVEIFRDGADVILRMP